jgi:hypothetical protein
VLKMRWNSLLARRRLNWCWSYWSLNIGMRGVVSRWRRA